MNHKKFIQKLLESGSFPSNINNSVSCLFGKKIILYGAGEGLMTFSVFVLKKYKIKPSLILDQKFKSKNFLLGIPALSPNKYKPTRKEKEKAIVVITVGKTKYHKEIIKYLRDSLGFENIVIANDIYECYSFNEPKELAKDGFKYFLENKNKILSSLNILEDSQSREIFTRFIQTHLEKKPVNIPSNDAKEQYFPLDVKLKKGYGRFINCGSYDGDTVRQLNKFHGKIESLACFEPDPDNFNLLIRYLQKNHNQIAKEIIACPCGVFSSNKQLKFDGGNKINSLISEKGDVFIQCVALDDVIGDFRPTFINMDIEGAELAALKGAENLIRKNKPSLAISVYHSPSDIWEILLYLHSLRLGYKFYLRNYSSYINDTVLYATV